MKTYVTLSDEFQLVIPKEARQKMGLTKAAGQRFRVERVTENEIVFKKDTTLDDYLGKYGDAFPKDAAAAIRRERDTEWD